MKKLNKKGFTLVELLAVIVILAILMVVAGSVIPNVQTNARKSAIKSEAQKLSNEIIENYQLWLIGGDTKPTDYQYGGGNIKKATAASPATITMKDGNFSMTATFDGTKVTAYCISDGNGTMLSSDTDTYDTTKTKCSSATVTAA